MNKLILLISISLLLSGCDDSDIQTYVDHTKKIEKVTELECQELDAIVLTIPTVMNYPNKSYKYGIRGRYSFYEGKCYNIYSPTTNDNFNVSSFSKKKSELLGYKKRGDEIEIEYYHDNSLVSDIYKNFLNN